MPLAFEDWAAGTPGPKSPLQTWLEGLFAGGPAPMQPDLVSQQLGAPLEPGQTRRPNVLPFTTDAQTGQLQLAMPRFLDILGNALPGAVPSALAPVKAAAGEKVLGAGPIDWGELTGTSLGQLYQNKLEKGIPPFNQKNINTLKEKAPQAYEEFVKAGLIKQAEELGVSVPPSPMKFGTAGGAQTLEEIISGLKNAQETQLKAVADWGPPKILPEAAPKAAPTIDELQAQLADLMKIEPAPKKDPFEQVPFTDEDYFKGHSFKEVPQEPSAFPADLPIATAPIKLYEDFLAYGFNLLPTEAALLKKTPEGQALVQKFADKGLWHEPGTAPGWDPPLEVGPSWDQAAEPERRAKRLLYEDEFIGPPLPQRELPLDEATRLARAAELGWRTDLPLYTGVPAYGPNILGFKDPQKGKWMENAIFLTDEPKITDYYTAGHPSEPLGQVVPAFVNPKNPKVVDWKKVTGDYDYQGTEMNKLIVDALAKGHDFMEVRNIGDVGGIQNQYLVFDPNILRSKFAKFDPKNIDANDLSAAIAAAFGIGGAGAALAPREKANF